MRCRTSNGHDSLLAELSLQLEMSLYDAVLPADKELDCSILIACLGPEILSERELLTNQYLRFFKLRNATELLWNCYKTATKLPLLRYSILLHISSAEAANLGHIDTFNHVRTVYSAVQEIYRSISPSQAKKIAIAYFKQNYRFVKLKLLIRLVRADRIKAHCQIDQKIALM